MEVKEYKEIAQKAHAGQFRHDGITPYISHVESVADMVHGDKLACKVAWLHDVLEDTKETFESLKAKGCEEEVLWIVSRLTKEKWISYDEYIHTVKMLSIAVKVKIADIIDNLSDSPSDHARQKYKRAIMILLS
jgi:(p)ppGpp synthase/HD superfamily hydrolase